MRYRIDIKGGNRGEMHIKDFAQPLVAGQAIQLDDAHEWHLVLRCWTEQHGHQATNRATVSLPGDSPQAALHEAIRYRHWK